MLKVYHCHLWRIITESLMFGYVHTHHPTSRSSREPSSMLEAGLDKNWQVMRNFRLIDWCLISCMIISLNKAKLFRQPAKATRIQRLQNFWLPLWRSMVHRWKSLHGKKWYPKEITSKLLPILLLFSFHASNLWLLSTRHFKDRVDRVHKTPHVDHNKRLWLIHNYDGGIPQEEEQQPQSSATRLHGREDPPPLELQKQKEKQKRKQKAKQKGKQKESQPPPQQAESSKMAQARPSSQGQHRLNHHLKDSRLSRRPASKPRRPDSASNHHHSIYRSNLKSSLESNLKLNRLNNLKVKLNHLDKLKVKLNHLDNSRSSFIITATSFWYRHNIHNSPKRRIHDQWP